MKKIIIHTLVLVLAFSFEIIMAQGVTITDNVTYSKDSSAILDVMSTFKGLLPPRMTTQERDAIINPVEGLIIFNISNNTLDLFSGTSWGSVTGEFLCGSSQVFDDDGNLYSTVQIGAQCWMIGNLNTGIMISSSIDQSDNTTIEKYCYNNVSDSCAVYGGLYQWNEMMQYVIADSNRGICPENWHLPSDAEWCILEQRMDPTISCSGIALRGTDGGTKLKQGGSSGFEALMAGRYITAASFGSIGTGGYFWTSSEDSASAWERYMYNSDARVGRNDQNKNYGLSVRCVYDGNTSKLPTVTTGQMSNIGATAANVSGEITDPGTEGAIVLHYGHCWSISPGPTLSDAFSDLGSSDTLGVFISNLHDLDESITYYVRAYGENNEGVSYGAEINFTTNSSTSCPGIPTITYGGQVYNTVLIGSQCWLKENLNIGMLLDGSIDQSDNSTIEKYCYNNEADSCAIYGGLYQWGEMMQYSTTPGAQGICPSGWHLPTDDEWKILEGTVDSQYPVGDPIWNGTGVRGYDAGLRLKSTYGWESGGNGTDDFDFTVLPGGYYYHSGSGSFLDLSGSGAYWTSSPKTVYASYGWMRWLFSDHNGVFYSFKYVMNGYSARCVKD